MGLLAVFCLAALPVAAQQVTPLQLDPNSAGSSLSGTLKPGAWQGYSLIAAAGEILTIRMEAADPRIRYSLFPPGHMPGSGALKGAADQSGRFQGVLPQSGAYLLQVHLTPEPAGAKGKAAPVARYRLHVAIAGAEAHLRPGDLPVRQPGG